MIAPSGVEGATMAARILIALADVPLGWYILICYNLLYYGDHALGNAEFPLFMDPGLGLWIAPLYHSYDLLLYKFDMMVSTCRYQGHALPFKFDVR